MTGDLTNQMNCALSIPMKTITKLNNINSPVPPCIWRGGTQKTEPPAGHLTLTREDEFAMRKRYQAILKKCFYNDLIQTRTALGLTQSQMAERLAMSDRAYIDLDHGKTACGGVTLIVYLCSLCLDPPGFLWRFWIEARSI